MIVARVPVTFVIALLCGLVFLIGGLVGPQTVFVWLHFPLLYLPEEQWQLWRWLTPAFVHFSLVHILFNVLWWWLLGGIVELRHGSGRLLILLLLAGVIPNFAQYLLSGPNFGGLSGVVYGLFGYAWIYGRLRPREGVFVSTAIMVQIVAWMVLGITGWLNHVIGPMANAAHLGGFLVGVAYAFFCIWSKN